MKARSRCSFARRHRVRSDGSGSRGRGRRRRRSRYCASTHPPLCTISHPFSLRPSPRPSPRPTPCGRTRVPPLCRFPGEDHGHIFLVPVSHSGKECVCPFTYEHFLAPEFGTLASRLGLRGTHTHTQANTQRGPTYKQTTSMVRAQSTAVARIPSERSRGIAAISHLVTLMKGQGKSKPVSVTAWTYLDTTRYCSSAACPGRSASRSASRPTISPNLTGHGESSLAGPQTSRTLSAVLGGRKGRTSPQTKLSAMGTG